MAAETVTVRFSGFARDLEVGEGERVCPECGGTCFCFDPKEPREGVTRTVGQCVHCSSGKQFACPHCGRWHADSWSVSRCTCITNRALMDSEAALKEGKRFEAAQHLTIEEAEAAGIEQVYDPAGHGDDGYMAIECADDPDFTEGAEWVWATAPTDLRIDAEAIVERACEDLHEEAGVGIPEAAYAELQAFLDASDAKTPVSLRRRVCGPSIPSRAAVYGGHRPKVGYKSDTSIHLVPCCPTGTPMPERPRTQRPTWVWSA